MNAKRSTHGAQWVGWDDVPASSPRDPVGAVLASELVLHQLAFEALALSIIREPQPVSGSVEDHRRSEA